MNFTGVNDNMFEAKVHMVTPYIPYFITTVLHNCSEEDCFPAEATVFQVEGQGVFQRPDRVCLQHRSFGEAFEGRAWGRHDYE